jgi:HAD superfamily hydrolase (TIGR01484 family)
MKKSLIATDFDGTLYIDGKIDKSTIDAIDRWRAQGGYFGVVTGRNIDFYDFAAELGLPFDYLIVCTGSLIVDKNKSVIYESLIAPDVFSRIEKTMSAYSDIIDYSKSNGLPRHHYYATFPDTERALQVRNELKAEFGDVLSVFVNGAHINIGSGGTGKAQGVDIVLRHFSLPPDSAAVIGDDYNDLDMILAHGGWAVESGKPAVVKQAPHTQKSVGSLIDYLLAENKTAV